MAEPDEQPPDRRKKTASKLDVAEPGDEIEGAWSRPALIEMDERFREALQRQLSKPATKIASKR